MAHRFVIMGLDGKLTTYESFEAIPEQFRHVIEFAPEVPPPPHGGDEHDEIALWNGRLQELMRRERACRRPRGSVTRT